MINIELHKAIAEANKIRKKTIEEAYLTLIKEYELADLIYRRAVARAEKKYKY